MPTPSTGFYGPGPGGVYIPAATLQIQVEFSRNPQNFAFPRYAQTIPSNQMKGYFPELDAIEAGRIAHADDYLWPDGQPCPRGTEQPLRWKAWNAERHAFAYQLGDMTVDQADYDIIGSHARMHAAKAMTLRSFEAMTLLETAASWPTGNTSATVDLLGGFSGANWYTGATTAGQYIKQSFALVIQAIEKATGGAANFNEICCIVNPNSARQMGASPEIVAYLTQHEQAMGLLQGNDAKMLNQYGLPPLLYGIKMIVENTVRTSTRRDEDDSATTSYTMSDDKAIFVTRQGAINDAASVVAQNMITESGNVVPSYSTLLHISKADMMVQADHHDWHKITRGRVVDTRDIVVSSFISGYLIQDLST